MITIKTNVTLLLIFCSSKWACRQRGMWWGVRGLRLLLALLALVVLEYFCGVVLHVSVLRTVLSPISHATQSFIKSRDSNNSYTDNTTFPNTNKSSVIFEKTPITVVTLFKSIADLPLCGSLCDFGPITVDKTKIEMKDVEAKYPEVMQGGWYKPENCTAKHNVAVLVPFRNREDHLPVMLNHIHPFLMRQQIEYRIFVIQQLDERAFNRAKLLNVGVVESRRLRPKGWDCFVLHDVDLLPMDQRALYACAAQPVHLSAYIDRDNFKLLYKSYFGGVSAVSSTQMTDVNGFSNNYWGWGGEDDDLCSRLNKQNYTITRYPEAIGRYTTLQHKKAEPNPKRWELLKKTKKAYKEDGLSSLKYNLLSLKNFHLYTLLSVNLDES